MSPSNCAVMHWQGDEDDDDEEEESSEEELPPREMPNRASRGRRMGQAMEDEEADAEFWGACYLQEMPTLPCRDFSKFLCVRSAW